MKAAIWFVSSYAPLLVILSLRFEPSWLRWALIVVAAASVAYVIGSLRRARASNVTAATITVRDDAGGEVGGYISAYLLPFLTVTEPTPPDLLAYAIFLLVAGLVYTRSNMLHINPTIYLLGYRVYRAEVPGRAGSAKRIWLLSQRTLHPSNCRQGHQFTPLIYIDHSAKD